MLGVDENIRKYALLGAVNFCLVFVKEYSKRDFNSFEYLFNATSDDWYMPDSMKIEYLSYGLMAFLCLLLNFRDYPQWALVTL